MTFGEIITRTLQLLGQDLETPRDFTRAEAGRFVNTVYREMVRDTVSLENQFWFQLTEGTATYALPANMGEIQRIAHRDQKIGPLSVFELDRINETWEDESGLIDAYTIFERNAGQIRTYRNPDYDNAEVLEDDYGVVIAATDEDGIELSNYHFRFESTEVSLGVVTDLEITDETVTFVAAADGGGADADYGLVVDITDFDISADDYGVVVDVEDDSTTDFDAVVFVGATEDTQMELGVVIDVEADERHFLFCAQEGVNFPVDPTEELGVVIWWKNDDEILEVWANEVPTLMVEDDESPRLPGWAHMSLVYGAVARMLPRVEQAATDDRGNIGWPTAAIYSGMHVAWRQFVKEMAVNSTREASRGFGQAVNGARRPRRGPRLPGEYPRV